MSHLRAFSAVALVLFGCSAFDAADSPPPPGDGGASSGADASADDAGTDAQSDAEACVRQKPPDAIICGDERCERGRYCCLSTSRCFNPSQTTCGSTQLNCTSKEDCSDDEHRCCNTGGGFGTQCMRECEPNRLVVCRSHEECGPNELCMPPENAEQPWWSCKPCPR